MSQWTEFSEIVLERITIIGFSTVIFLKSPSFDKNYFCKVPICQSLDWQVLPVNPQVGVAMTYLVSEPEQMVISTTYLETDF